MPDALRWVVEATGASGVRRGERIQSLWGGYGEIFRVHLEGAEVPSAIVKWVAPPARVRGSDASHARKCRSYEVEAAWYRTRARECDSACRVPALLGSRAVGDERQLLLEDLDAAGFSERRHAPKPEEVERCLAWLAAFHARFLGVTAQGLWKTGTYWHLATRSEELAAVEDAALREAAPLLDRKLRSGVFQTLVHGDAKPANFCFARGGRGVAAVDFQYVGGGCGMKDVAYLLSSPGRGEVGLEGRYLETYFGCLRRALGERGGMVRGEAGIGVDVDVDALEREWRELYPIACADFYRFLAGWAKDHWKRESHGQRVVREVLRALG